MKWTAYSLSVPIDFGWEYLPNILEAGEMIAAQRARDLIRFGGVENDDAVTRFKADWDRAKSLALAVGWEGDGGEPEAAKVFWLPSFNTFTYGFALKQANDGTTFVISPHALSWLAD